MKSHGEGKVMQPRWSWIGGLALGALVLAVMPAEALILRLTPLKDVLAEGQFIFVAKVDQLLPERPAMVLLVTEDLKGKFPARRLPVNLTGDEEAKKLNHTPQLLKRLAPELPLVLFANQRGKRVTIFAFANGTWFQMVGQKGDSDDKVVLAFTHCEPYLRRTFKGTTAELQQIISDGLAGKKAPPEPNPKEPPGLGPEVKTSRLPSGSGGPLFAVIPTLGIGGPLAILALLFPSLFGGVLLLFRHWMAFLTVSSTNFTLLLVHGWLAGGYWGEWWTTPTALWLTMTLITLLGTVWAWRRQVRSLQGEAVPTPARTEHIMLGVLSLCSLAGVLLFLLGPPSAGDPTWNLVLALAIGIWTATLLKLLRALFLRGQPGYGLTTEGTMLSVVLLVLVSFAAARSSLPEVTSEVNASETGRPVARLLDKQLQSVVLNENGSGMIVSSARVAGDRLYVAVAHRKGLESFGVLYCLDRHTLKTLWTFDNDGDLKQVYSSPSIVDGRLFIGEGFHDDQNCRLFCVDAATGKKLWLFQTGGQTESSPTAADGKVFFGAGNEGVYALDAASGKKLWQYAPGTEKNIWRVAASPLVVSPRLYIGSGVDRNRPDNPGETSIVCLDTDTGKEIWKVKTDLPAWAGPVMAGDRLYCGLGNGDVFSDAAQPRGAMLCLSAANGKERWRKDLPNAVLERAVVDRHSVYFGCRDGHVYCLGRFKGEERWKKDLGSPVIATPVLDGNSPQPAINLFAIASKGRVSCLDPQTGQIHWSFHALEALQAHLCSSPVLTVEPTAEGDRRLLYFGTALNDKSVPALYRLEDLLPAITGK